MCGTSAETVSVTSDPGVWEGGRLRVSPTHVGAARGVWVRRVGALRGPQAGADPRNSCGETYFLCFIN